MHGEPGPLDFCGFGRRLRCSDPVDLGEPFVGMRAGGVMVQTGTGAGGGGSAGLVAGAVAVAVAVAAAVLVASGTEGVG